MRAEEPYETWRRGYFKLLCLLASLVILYETIGGEVKDQQNKFIGVHIN